MKINRISMTFLVITVCLAAVFVVRTFRPDPEEILKRRTAERSIGSDKAPLWITEYFDYQCPPCANAAKLLKLALEEHPGQIYVQVRYFPLPSHKNSMKATLYGECASRQKGTFWKIHEEIFNRQAEWAMDSYPEIKFTDYAAKAGLNMKKLEACVSDPETEKTVRQEKAEAEKLGVKITPSFFINGKMAVGTSGLKDGIKAFFEPPSAAPAAPVEAETKP